MFNLREQKCALRSFNKNVPKLDFHSINCWKKGLSSQYKKGTTFIRQILNLDKDNQMEITFINVNVSHF